MKHKLGYCGPNVQIFEPSVFIQPEKFHLHGYDIISEFCHMYGGLGVKIGQFFHLSAGSAVIGGGHLLIEDYTAVGTHSKLITGADKMDGSSIAGAAVPKSVRRVDRSFVHIQKYVVVTTGCIIFPGVTIGEGSVIGAGSVVMKDVEPWTVVVGNPARAIKTRPKDKILELAQIGYEETGTEPFIPGNLPWLKDN